MKTEREYNKNVYNLGYLCQVGCVEAEIQKMYFYNDLVDEKCGLKVENFLLWGRGRVVSFENNGILSIFK